MKEIEIYWQDLTEKMQNEIRKALNMDDDDNGNWDVLPITTLMFEDVD